MPISRYVRRFIGNGCRVADNSGKTFWKEFLPAAAGSSYTTVLVNGGLDDQSQPGGAYFVVWGLNLA